MTKINDDSSWGRGGLSPQDIDFSHDVALTTIAGAIAAKLLGEKFVIDNVDTQMREYWKGQRLLSERSAEDCRPNTAYPFGHYPSRTSP